MFEISPSEMALRKKLGIDGEPELFPALRFMQLSAFWPHWTLHKRMCDTTGKEIISIYSEDCPYPVWHKDEWVKYADPPSKDCDTSKEIFPQLWELFRQSPIAHTMGTGNQNCEYTDDWWYSRNCYLCHSGVECEDCRYCYRTIGCKDCQYAVFSFASERCIDLVFSHRCFDTIHALNCWNCTDCAFVYDCRNCNHCFLSSNLRNKQYVFHNQQCTKEEYEENMRQWNLDSRKTYQKALSAFTRMLREDAWHRALFIDRCENSHGNFLDECKNCLHCFFLTSQSEDCANVMRGAVAKDCLDSVSPFESELLYCTSLCQSHCYDIKFGYNLIECKWMEYCAHCFQCEHCFGCCGLLGKQYHLFNTPYSPEEYEERKRAIIDAMIRTGEYGQFFPGHFAAHPYEESLAGFYWPLDHGALEKFGFRPCTREERREPAHADIDDIPESARDATEELSNKVLWDTKARRPFQIQKADIAFATMLHVPLPHTSYAHRIKTNFRYIPFDGTTRLAICAHCHGKTHTSWPKEYDGRILCEECYLKEVY